MKYLLFCNRLVLKKKNKRVREEDVAKSLSTSLRNNPNLGAALIIDILQLSDSKDN